MERIYTVQAVWHYSKPSPCIKISGKWLGEFGIDYGSRVKLVETEDGFLLTKISEEISDKEGAF